MPKAEALILKRTPLYLQALLMVQHACVFGATATTKIAISSLERPRFWLRHTRINIDSSIARLWSAGILGIGAIYTSGDTDGYFYLSRSM